MTVIETQKQQQLDPESQKAISNAAKDKSTVKSKTASQEETASIPKAAKPAKRPLDSQATKKSKVPHNDILPPTAHVNTGASNAWSHILQMNAQK